MQEDAQKLQSKKPPRYPKKRPVIWFTSLYTIAEVPEDLEDNNFQVEQCVSDSIKAPHFDLSDGRIQSRQSRRPDYRTDSSMCKALIQFYCFNVAKLCTYTVIEDLTGELST